MISQDELAVCIGFREQIAALQIMQHEWEERIAGRLRSGAAIEPGNLIAVLNGEHVAIDIRAPACDHGGVNDGHQT